MSTKKQLGIWMDHSEANLIEFNNEVAKTTATIQNTFDHNDMESALNRSEELMHNKRQQHQTAYYKKLEDVIILNNEVILFGPTDAKKELLNMLRTDLRFKDIKIEVESADKMSENQKHAFVKTYFS
ncbi:MAG: hypothetical protein ABI207_05395 [Crocinitomicaceae bacterium]